MDKEAAIREPSVSKAVLPIGDNAKHIKEGLENLLAVKIRKYDMFFVPLDARITKLRF